MGSAFAEGENRAIDAVKSAMTSPLLDDNEIIGASNILLYITSGVEEISMDEVTEITDYIQDEAGQNAEIIWGNGVDESLGNKIGVTLIATGFNSKNKNLERENLTIHTLNDEVSITPKINMKPKEEVEVGEIQLIREPGSQDDREPGSQNDESNNMKPEQESKKEHRSIVFDMSSPVINEDENEPPEKVMLNEPTLMRKPEAKSSDSDDQSIKIVPPKSDFENKENSADIEKRSQDRVQRLRELSIKLKSPEDLDKLEKEPAYLRRKVELNDTNPSDESLISKFTLSDDNNNGTTLRENNSFLHENVD